jgi:hypothetical protein
VAGSGRRLTTIAGVFGKRRRWSLRRNPELGVAAERYELTLTPWGTLEDAFGRDYDPATGLPQNGELPFRWCAGCGTPIAPVRLSHRYCSERCRKKAWQDRKAAAEQW